MHGTRKNSDRITARFSPALERRFREFAATRRMGLGALGGDKYDTLLVVRTRFGYETSVILSVLKLDWYTYAGCIPHSLSLSLEGTTKHGFIIASRTNYLATKQRTI